ncbi:hypothetical protein AN639_10210 [Candidatus Epulonipiscium fishelsonii]|uniref:Uncharacterized protein n=1 Tax=Candidatus Epulonipiscium fishelsonii TaxID=77094 RepID=A0ACC8XCT7_9FIRM|nr:hypothetical protein AN396_05700 [Epulopiscium sp. SCG-B11WGA-EpuloA1]ONI43632.1 hypothetical protein AN639_10210 [Epulopiscium sp. SCG-B05WGA-EpuloA1]
MNLGIVGTGNIVKECLNAISEINEIICTSIICREQSIQQANLLATKYNITSVYTDYDEFLNSPDIDFVYIGIINNLHYEYTKKALLKGKHVICEKPFTTSYNELLELAEIAKQNNLFLFEAVTFIHSDNFKFIESNISKIGPIKLIQCNYSQYSSRYDKYLENIVLPAFDPKFAGGALYDINIYNLHFIVYLFGMPRKMFYHKNVGFNSIDTSGIAVLEYNKFYASAIGAKDSNSPGFAIIQGELGYIKVNGPVNVCPEVEIVTKNNIEKFSINNFSSRMCDELYNFNQMFKQSNLEECYRLLNHSLNVMKVVDVLKV